MKERREPLSLKRGDIIKNIIHTVDGLRPIDDTFFRKLAEKKEFCEELLQVILQKPDLKLLENIPQRSFHNLDGRFKNICSTIRYYKAGKGRGEMCEIVEEYAREYAKEYAAECVAAQKIEWNRSLAIDMIRSNYSNDEIHKLLKFSLEDITKLRNEVKYLS